MRIILCIAMLHRRNKMLIFLQRLPVKLRSTCRTTCLCYHCHSNYCTIICRWYAAEKAITSRNTRSILHIMRLLNRQAHSKATFGDYSFSFASSSTWKSNPNDARCAPSLSSSKSRLKAYLFRSVYKD